MPINAQKLPYIIGIGASAGGLEALETFFDTFPQDSGAALVVIQHLSPDFKSLMVELLSRHTDMEIKRVEDRELIKPNTVYLISPNKNIRMNGNELIAEVIDPNRHLRHPIDHFLFSLAEAQGHRAISVILSGTGSDGTKGSAAIKEKGGLTIAQSPETCKFDGMPVSLIKNGSADKILPPQEMASAILQFTDQYDKEDEDLEPSNEAFHEILEILQEHEGVDFSRYRPSTVARRIERRLQLNQVSSLDQYLELVKKDAYEVKELHNELLIGVTRFFRDAEAFKELELRVIPKIIEQCQNRIIRVWTLGCSTGEEAYSLSILFHEAFERAGTSRELKIFATDVDKDAINIASHGIYPEAVVSDIDPVRLTKYFNKRDKSYQINNLVRSSIIFSQHNVTRDPPFTNLDLISCRNLLIYFQPKLQNKVISLIHFGLRQDAFLFLGKSEALGDLAKEFEVVNPTFKIFKKLRDVKLSLVSDIDITSNIHSSYRNRAKPKDYNERFSPFIPRDSQISTIYENLLNEYVPPSILIDEHYNLIHTFGHAHQFLDVPRGKSSLDVQKMLPRELSIALSMAVSKAKTTLQETLFKDIKVSRNEQDFFYQIKVRPFISNQSKNIHSLLVSFDEVKYVEKSIKETEIQNVESYDAHKHYLEKIKTLEEQLRITRESLQSTIEELETTNEELQSTNEELMSSNEELQSSNEELHSVNEELYTVNSEYQSKIKELTTANNDIDFLLRSINVGLIFLDQKLKIRRYNEDIKRFINLMPHDIGRPITDIKFNYQHEAITDVIERVRESGESEYLSIIVGESEYLANAIPYFTLDPKYLTSKEEGMPSGLVISFLDITKMNHAIERARKH